MDTDGGREAGFWKRLEDKGEGGRRVQCRLCSHFCVIDEGSRGLCAVRENRGGVLFSLVDGLPAAVSVDPIEKKPLFHFLPGTGAFSLGTMGCDLSCSFCQNADLSQAPRQGRPVAGRKATAGELVEAALAAGAKSIAYTYSEPTVFLEFAMETARLATARGLKNILVTNGFMSPEALDACGQASTGPFQAANVDLKSFSDAFYRERCGARLDPVLQNLAHMRKLGWWIEVTTLVIPGLNDGDAELAGIAGFIADELGPNTPWHLSRFHPSHRLTDRPVTPTETLLSAREIGLLSGLRYVYIGNATGPGFGDTFCPACHGLVIGREGFETRVVGLLEDGRCSACGKPIPGVWS